MNRERSRVASSWLSILGLTGILLVSCGLDAAQAQPKPEGEMRLHQRAVRQRRLADVGVRAERRDVRAGRRSRRRRAVQAAGRETDKKKREAMLHRIQQLLYERVRFGPIYEYIRPSGVGPRVAEPALLLIDPYPWSAPLEEVRLKAK